MWNQLVPKGHTEQHIVKSALQKVPERCDKPPLEEAISSSTRPRFIGVLLYTAVLRRILSYGCPVWGYAAKTNINILDVAQNALIRMIVGACRYIRNDEIRNAIKIPSFKSHIQKLAKNFFNSLNSSENVNMQNLENYTARIKRKRPRSILLDSYNPP
ncbi:putative RNA-directed DNA polymerase from transposon X-element [Trichonephila clavipes]|nr:putative RNA-directed DNA polymerase from transposon X-element [Trichonephila clavipes]